MCDFFSWQRMEMDVQGGDLADIVRAAGLLLSPSAADDHPSSSFPPPWWSADDPAAITGIPARSTTTASFGELRLSYEDLPLPEMAPPFVDNDDREVSDTQAAVRMNLDCAGDNGGVGRGGGLLLGEEMKGAGICNIFIPSCVAPAPAISPAAGKVSSPPAPPCGGGDGGKIPLSPRMTGIKRRKSQVKKVVCIPAPATSSSGGGSNRPSSGGEVVPSDLWAWRKYGQKPIKGSPYPRGYYRCSSSKGCLARKQVERSRTDPNMLVITYTSEHNHPWPTQRNALAGSTRSSTAQFMSPPPPPPPAANHLNKPPTSTKQLPYPRGRPPLPDDFFAGGGACGVAETEELLPDPISLIFARTLIGPAGDRRMEEVVGESKMTAEAVADDHRRPFDTFGIWGGNAGGGGGGEEPFG